ncbi:hypothetical protein [Roseomonas sp. AR75]|uniref:hypothetical protein n=1 Tax=Roseomonas sp. AR75 TaxID=2562311 RepID=UPI0010C052AF|nr:hypothetical protein [Roseomonas sp. AR75]
MSAPTHHLLWLEGVDFAETLEDTTTLSVIRGSSLTLLAAAGPALTFLSGRHPDYECVFGGASIALFRAPVGQQQIAADATALIQHLHTSGVAPDTSGRTPPFAHLRFVVGTAVDDGTGAGPALAQGCARRMQLAGTVPRRPSVAGQHGPCLFSQQRVGDTTLNLRGDHAARFDPAADPEAHTQAVRISTSALARWHYGRVQRQAFYRTRRPLAETLGRLRVTDNFEDMISLRQARGQPDDGQRFRQGLPLALLGKIAVVYADGNGFTKIRKAMGGGPDALRRFSRRADRVVRFALAAAMAEVAKTAAQSDLRAAAVFHDAKEAQPSERDQLRFETLLYGGDEICFVAPAWFALAMAAAFFETVKGRTIGPHPLTFAMGIALAPVAMPIRASYDLAKSLADSTKGGGARRNSLAIHAFESVEPPGNGLQSLREGLFGETSQPGGGAHPLLALEGDRFAANLAAFAQLRRDASLPRSQLFRMMQAAQWPDRTDAGFSAGRKLNDPAANEAAASAFARYRSAAGRGVADQGWAALLADNRQAAMAAWLMTHLWDYVAPLENLGSAKGIRR